MFQNYSYEGRTKKCVKLKSPSGETVYCLYPVFHKITHNPCLNWSIISRKNLHDEKTYKFIQVKK